MLKVRIYVARHPSGSLCAQKQSDVVVDAIVLRYYVTPVYILSVLSKW